MKIITIGGQGYWGQKLTRVLTEQGHTICQDLSLPDKAEVLLPELRGDAEAVVIATPAENHARLIWLAMDLGLDVLVTKPMTLQLNQAMAIANRAEQKKLVISVDSTFVHSDIFKHLNGVASKLIHYQSSRLAYGPFYTPTPPSWDLLSHDVAILLALGMRFGETVGKEDKHNAMMQATFENGGTAWVNASRRYFTKVRNIIVEFEGAYPYVWKDDALWSLRDGDIDFIMRQQTEPLTNVVANFADRCVNRELVGITDAAHGVGVCRVLHDTFGMPDLALGLDKP